MSKIKNGALDQYGTESFIQQQFGTAGVEGVNLYHATLHPSELYNALTLSRCQIKVTIYGLDTS